MDAKDLQKCFDEVRATTGLRVADRGFRRRSDGVLVHEGADSVAMIGFQKSMTSTKQTIRFTVNLGVAVAVLLELSSAKKPKLEDSHVHRRIGSLLPNARDKWWDISSLTDCGVLAAEVAEAVDEFGIPFLLRYQSAASVMALWESGQSPGLTAGQRDRLLLKLKASK